MKIVVAVGVSQTPAQQSHLVGSKQLCTITSATVRNREGMTTVYLSKDAVDEMLEALQFISSTWKSGADIAGESK